MSVRAAQYPFRDMVTKRELLDLSIPRPGRVAWDIAKTWAQILSAWIFAYWMDSAWWTLLAMAVVGNRYYTLFIIGHDGLHRRLHADPCINDLVNDGLLLGPIGAITRVNRTNHMQHHRSLGLPHDPDGFKYASRSELTALGLLFSFTGLPYVLKAMQNVFFNRKRQPAADANIDPGNSSPDRPHYRLRDLAILVGWQSALVLGLTSAFGWWGYPLMWLVPVAVFTVAFDLLRVFCEHSVDDGAKDAGTEERMIMVTSSSIERLLFSPMHMNHHVAHHVWPSVPYFNLPAATRLIEQRSPDSAHRMIYRDGYLSYLGRCLGKALRSSQEGKVAP